MEACPKCNAFKVWGHGYVPAYFDGQTVHNPISVEIQGTGMDELISFADSLKSDMEKIPGLVDVSISQKDPRPELQVIKARIPTPEWTMPYGPALIAL